MTFDEWLRTHAFLDPVARWIDRVERALAGVECPEAEVPHFDEYAADHEAGVPLLRSAEAGVDLLPAGSMTCALIDVLASGWSPAVATSDRLAAAAGNLGAELGLGGAAAQRVVDWLLGDDGLQYSSPGLLRFLGWTAARRWLRPVAAAFAGWRNQDGWQRSQCPLCGSLPAMAQLVGVDPGRMRFLACGCCGTRWRYRRTACPFCADDAHKVLVVAVEGEAGLRLDHCGACRGYLKTYVGQGSEDVLLADWTSLHLDVLARDRGLLRAAASLYDLDPVTG
jgi:FdhE protein